MDSRLFLFFVTEDMKEKINTLIEEKCELCFRKDSAEERCMLYSSKHAGIEICLGPFKDQEDRLKKIREDFERERKPKADIDKVVKEVGLNNYLRNKKLFDEWVSKNNEF